MPNITILKPQFNSIARRHRFNATNNTENRIKDLVSKPKTPLGHKNSARQLYTVFHENTKVWICGRYKKKIGNNDQRTE